MSALAPAAKALPANYLTTDRPHGTDCHIVVDPGWANVEYSLLRPGHAPGKVVHVLNSRSVSLHLSATPEEARQIGEAWIKAAEDAEAALRLQRDEEDREVDRQRDADIEADRRREFEARGEEYPGPMALSGEDLQHLQLMRAEGHALEPWATRLLDGIDALKDTHEATATDATARKAMAPTLTKAYTDWQANTRFQATQEASTPCAG